MARNTLPPFTTRYDRIEEPTSTKEVNQLVVEARVPMSPTENALREASNYTTMLREAGVPVDPFTMSLIIERINTASEDSKAHSLLRQGLDKI